MRDERGIECMYVVQIQGEKSFKNSKQTNERICPGVYTICFIFFPLSFSFSVMFISGRLGRSGGAKEEKEKGKGFLVWEINYVRKARDLP